MTDAHVQCGLQGAAVADVRHAGDDPRAGRFDVVDGRGHVVVGAQRVGHARDLAAQIDRDDVGTLRGKRYRVSAALTARGAGDEGDFAFECAGQKFQSSSSVTTALPIT